MLKPLAVALILPIGLTACMTRTAPPVVVEPVLEVEPAFEFAHEWVWTAAANTEVMVDSAVSGVVARPFARLRVLEAREDGLTVRCESCPDTLSGEVRWEDVVFEAGHPVEAAAEGLGTFLLALRDAAERRDVEALRRVMAREFTHSMITAPSREAALASWEVQEFTALDVLVELLDRGVATRDSRLWAAPPEHLESLHYRGYRAGFRESPHGEWEWVFLMRSDRQ